MDGADKKGGICLGDLDLEVIDVILDECVCVCVCRSVTVGMLGANLKA